MPGACWGCQKCPVEMQLAKWKFNQILVGTFEPLCILWTLCRLRKSKSKFKLVHPIPQICCTIIAPWKTNSSKKPLKAPNYSDITKDKHTHKITHIFIHQGVNCNLKPIISKWQWFIFLTAAAEAERNEQYLHFSQWSLRWPLQYSLKNKHVHPRTENEPPLVKLTFGAVHFRATLIFGSRAALTTL